MGPFTVSPPICRKVWHGLWLDATGGFTTAIVEHGAVLGDLHEFNGVYYI